MKTFYLPDLGEGLPDGEINQWHVKEGDMIKEDDLLVSIETAKAVVEVPSPMTGKVVKLHGKVGDVILTGSALVDFDVQEDKQESSTVAGEIKAGNEILMERALSVGNGAGGIKVLPAVRALAKKMNVDLTRVAATGPNGTITMDDVKKASASPSAAPVANKSATVAPQSALGPIEPLRGVRRTMAQVMSHSHAEVVPVTIYDDADITAWVKDKDFTVRTILAMIKAAASEPALNAWFDGRTPGRRLFSQLHLGLAMDTEDGLFVPVIQDAQEKTATQLRAEVEQLKKEVRDRSIPSQKLQGATLVLSNFGSFAGRYASPIVVPPTVAILGVGALRQVPLVVDGQVVARSILPLSLSFDHRAVTGGEATRFLGVLIQQLQQASV